MGPRVWPAGFNALSGGRLRSRSSRTRRGRSSLPARALSAGWRHDRFASRHMPGGKVTRRFGGGSYSPPWRADWRTEDSTRRGVAPPLVLAFAGRTACSAFGWRWAGTGSVPSHEGQWPSVGSPSDPS